MAEPAQEIDFGIDPYDAFGENAGEICEGDKAANDSLYGAPEATGQNFNTTPGPTLMTSLAAFAAGSPNPDPAPQGPQAKADVNPKVKEVLEAPVQKAGTGQHTVKSTEKLVEQGQDFAEAKRSLGGPAMQGNGPKKDILGDTVNPSLAGRAMNFAVGTAGAGLTVAAAAVFGGPKLAAAAGLAFAAKDAGAFVSAVNGPRTAEETIAAPSQYKASDSAAKGFGAGKSGMRGGYDYASMSRGPSPEQQVQMQSSGSAPIVVDPLFRTQNARSSLEGISGATLNKEDPTVRALNVRGRELAEQMTVQQETLRSSVATSWKAVAEAREDGVNLKMGDNPTYGQLVPKEQLARLEEFKPQSLTMG